MGFSVGLSNWPTSNIELFAALEAFGRARGRRFDVEKQQNAPLGNGFWREAATRRENTSPTYGFQRGYDPKNEPIAWAIEDFLRARLHLQEWLDRGKSTPMSLALVPFQFSDGARGEPPWTEVGSGSNKLLVGCGAGFVTYWDGGYEDEEGRAYRARAEAAYAELANTAAVPDASTIALALELTFYELILAGWDRNLLVSISF